MRKIIIYYKRILFTVKLEFPKILAPRLPQDSSNVNIECAGISNVNIECAGIYLHFIILILICF